MNISIHEIFHSIQGETTRSGFASVFIRLSGCNLHCNWCDTPASLENGRTFSIESVMQAVRSFPRPDHVTITGGEPLLQKGTINLIRRLLDESYTVQLETNGSLSLKDVPRNVSKIADIKPPSSGECGSFKMENLRFLGMNDEIKIVLADGEDLVFAEKFIMEHLLGHPSVINLSPAGGLANTGEIPELLLRAPWNEGTCRVRLNIQLHKIIGRP